MDLFISPDASHLQSSLWSAQLALFPHLTDAARFPCVGLGWDNRETSTSASVGEVLANCEAKLVGGEDGETEIQHPDQRGELWVRGPNVMKGYWRNPSATRDTITPDGWLKTGDVAYRDAKNKFYIVDRKKVSVLSLLLGLSLAACCKNIPRPPMCD